MKENEKTVNQFGKNVKHQRIFVVNDPTMCRIIPSLAMEIGLNESILFMQLEFWISITPDDDTHVRDGKKWIWKSVRDMQDEVFPFWSIDKINRIVNNLLKQKLIFVNTSYNKFSYDKTRWFAINFDTVSKLNSLKVNDFTPTLSQNKTPLYGNADEQNQDVTSTLSQNRTGVSQNKTTIPETTTRDKNNDDSKDLNFLSDDAEKASSLSSFSSAGNEDSGNQLDDDSGNQPDSSALNDLIGMIPEKMRVPVVKNLVSQSLAEKGLCFVRDAIAYTNDRKKVANKDTWQAYRTYFSKCLNGEYSGVAGYFESSDKPIPADKPTFKNGTVIELFNGNKGKIDDGFGVFNTFTMVPEDVIKNFKSGNLRVISEEVSKLPGSQSATGFLDAEKRKNGTE